MPQCKSVHLALIACRFNTIPNLEFDVLNGVFGGTAYALMYLMLITSFDAPARAIGPKAWRILHKTGLYFLGLIFVATLLPDPGDEMFTVARIWFFALTKGAVLIRLTAFSFCVSRYLFGRSVEVPTLEPEQNIGRR